MKTQIVSIETEKSGGEWCATLWLAGVGTVHQATATRPTQCAAIAAACRVARENLGREFVPATGNAENDYHAFCDAMESLADVHGG